MLNGADPGLDPGLRDRLHEGVRLFDAGEHWHAHEAWETAWRADRAPDRDHWKGLIQLAAACHHLRRGNRRPLPRLLTRATHLLATHHGPRWPFDLHALRLLAARIATCGEGEGLPKLGDCLRG